MGSFSWLKADNLTKIANIYYECPFKFLIPKEFGGGFIKDHYQDYGYLGHKEDGSPKYDMYEILAFWNADMIYPYSNYPYTKFTNKTIKDILKFNGSFPQLKEIDEFSDDNRSIGIDIGIDDDDMEKLKYPLKLVSASYKGTYEDCNGISYTDPDQGFYPVKR